MVIQALLMNGKDNVATLLEDISKSDEVSCNIGRQNVLVITVRQDIPKGHKIAIKNIKKGNIVYKYGFPIGYALSDIQIGEHVHIHNIASLITEE